MIPVRQILTPEDLDQFLKSPACSEIVVFLNALNESVIGVKTTDTIEESAIIQQLMQLLESIKQTNTDVKPFETNSRFGNPAFRDFYDKCEEMLPVWLAEFVPAEHVEEVSKYAQDSFGNRRRIDYGTGHELNFLIFLLCLHKLALVTADDFKALVIHVFFKYVEVMRSLQMSYWLEPAGSHGVWGLDDYQFLPFLFGAGQLRTHKHLRPKSIHNPEVLDEFSKDYIYFECVRFVNSIKTGSIRWHSPMLDDISSAKTWEKVNLGMVKMFRAEVIGKLPIMQHFMFGSLVSFSGGNISGVAAHGADDCDHGCGGHTPVYAFGQEFPDCCGIKVPSAIAASQAGNEVSTEPRNAFTRPIPFD
ncbi:Serine/threonine-protein phosphatase 2A activator 2 [Kickxella alabastrina]|uniref:Serine/threonine-protein phosphatase 2A activator 2 n=1 Tax=Kickxella alabastrina TaxID=61397 RepID=A0ACC1IFK9_9FUNG|nr:Serine/threonine-protein phosphatase 2A activator 2 [Kickxella alabastrina]